MRCRKVRIDLEAYLNHSLDAAGAAKLEQHLAHCRDCAAELRFLKAYREKKVAIPHEKAPENFLAKVEQRLDEDNSSAGFFNNLFRARARWRAPFIPQMAGLAVVFIVIVLVFQIHEHTTYNFQKEGPEKSVGSISSQTSMSTPTIRPESAPVQKKQAGKGSIAQNIHAADGTNQTFKAVGSIGSTSSIGPVNSIPETRINVMPDVPESSATAKLAENEPATAPLMANSAGPKIVRLVIEPPSGINRAVSDTVAFSKMEEVVKKAVQAEKIEKSGIPEEIAPEKSASDLLKALLKKYDGRMATSGNNSTQNTDTWILEIPIQKYQEFLTDLEKMGQIKETPQATGASGGISREVELRLQLGPE